MEKAFRDPQSSSSYGNFSFMFYGVLTNSPWTQIFVDYPEINTLPPKELGKRAFEIVLKTLINDPLASIQGIIAQWRAFFFKKRTSMFFTNKFIDRHELELGLESALRFLSLVGIADCLYKFKKPTDLPILK